MGCVALSQVGASHAKETHTTSAAATQTVENLIEVIENPIKRELFLDSLKQIVAGNDQTPASDKKNR